MGVLVKGTTFSDGDQVTSAKLNNLVDNATFDPSSVDNVTTQLATGKIVVKTIDSGNIASNAVTTAKIADSSVTTAKIADSNVTTAKIADDAVTNAKIADNAVEQAQMADSSVGTAEIIDANITAAKLDGAQTGSAPIYGARAWVNFDGTANSNLSGTYTRTGSSTTVTVTATAHGLIVGNSVNLDFTSGLGADGIYTVGAVVDANNFTVTTVASTATSGNVTLLRNTIRASGNVSSITDNGTGDYTVNFTTAMPDANYCVTNSVGSETSSSADDASSLHPFTKTTSSVRVYVGFAQASGNIGFNDYSQIDVAIFR